MTIIINNNTSSTLSLGQALAYLRAEKTLGRSFEKISDEDKSFLDALRKKRKTSNDPKYFTQLLEQVYASSKESTHKIDELNIEFFLELFLTDSDDRDCMRLAMKLNDHFDRFEYFSDVLRDFLNKYDSLMDENYVS